MLRFSEYLEEENKKPRAAKGLIYQTDVYGAKGYFGQCKEPGCDHKTKTYDRITQAQNAIKKHHQKHFKVNESGPFAGKPKKLKPLKDRLKGGIPGDPRAVNLKAWMDEKKRRKAEYMKNREKRDENS